MDDRELLERFVVEREEAAFVAILRRHGSMVRAVCRRLLHQETDADDAFQATFLILLRKAGSIAKRESLASWLHGVARRVSIRAKAGLGRERSHSRLDSCFPAQDGMQEIMVRDLQRWLDRAVHTLPEPFRASFILCCMEGKSYAQAARLLGCAEGTVSSRVVRARERLRTSLERSSLGASAGILTVELSRGATAVPSALVESVLESMRQGAGASALATTTKAGLLAQGVLQTMFLTKLKILTALLIVMLVATGFTTQAYLGSRAQGQTGPAKSPGLHPEWSGDLVGIPARVEGVIEFVGTEIKPGEKVPENRVITIHAANNVQKYRKLRVGDVIEKGQLLGQLDDRPARAELSIKLAKVAVSEADLLASEKTRDEACERWLTQKRLQVKGASSLEDVRGAN